MSSAARFTSSARPLLVNDEGRVGCGIENRVAHRRTPLPIAHTASNSLPPRKRARSGRPPIGRSGISCSPSGIRPARMSTAAPDPSKGRCDSRLSPLAAVALALPASADAALPSSGGRPLRPGWRSPRPAAGTRAGVGTEPAGDRRRQGLPRVPRRSCVPARARTGRCACAIARTHSYRVAGIDTRGAAGPRSEPVRVLRGHRPPTAPGPAEGHPRHRLARAPVVAAARARRSGRLAGYRIFRDGLPVRQVRGRAGVDRDLAPATRYRFTVAAIDTQGYMSASTAPVSVTTARPPAVAGPRARVPARLDRRELPRPPAPLHARSGRSTRRTSTAAQSDGAITGRDDPLVTSWSQLRGILVLPRFNCQRGGHAAPDPDGRGGALGDDRRGSSELVREHGYDGINIDFENGAAADRDALTSFVSDLRGPAARDRQAPLGGGVGEVPAHDDGAVRLLRLRGPRTRRPTTCSS